MILVVGATGALGYEICKRLRARGAAVRSLVRPGSMRESEVHALGAEIAYGDLKTPATLAAACDDVSCIVSTASAMRSRSDGDTLETVDLNGHLSLVRAAIDANVERFVYTSVSSEAHPGAPLVRYKRRIERAVRESGMGWTVLQPALFAETWFSPAAGWDIEQGRVRMVGTGKAQINPVSIDDVAEFAARAAADPELERRVIPIGGPDTVTAYDVAAIFGEALGKKLAIKHVPANAIALAGKVVRPFNPVLSSSLLLSAGYSRGEVIQMALVLSEIPVELTPVREVVGRLCAGLLHPH
jgi:uncharacterized protein YbjT (DUF2867 family)